MSKLRSVNTHFWDDGYIADLDPLEKFLFLYLLTSPLANIAGCYEIPLKKISYDTGLSTAEISQILNRFKHDGKVVYQNGWVLIVKFLKHQKLNDNMRKGVVTILTDAPPWTIETLLKALKGFESLLNPLLKYEDESEDEVESESEKEGEGEGKKESAEAAAPPPASPPKPKAEKPHILPEDYRPPDEFVLWAADQCPDVDIESELEEFVDFWREIATKNNKRTTRGWNATWKKRMKEQQSRFAGRAQPKPANNGHKPDDMYGSAHKPGSPAFEITVAKITDYKTYLEARQWQLDNTSRQLSEIEEYERSYQFRKRFPEAVQSGN